MHFDWTAPDGAIFPCESWLPGGPARGLLVCIHGLGGAATYFSPIAAAVNPMGLACYGLNLRGHGLDPILADRGATVDLAAIARDVSHFVADLRRGHPGVPLFFCGESLGSLITASLLVGGHLGAPRGVILSVPVVALIKPTPWHVRHIVRFLAVAAPRLRVSPSRFVSGRSGPLQVTRDERFKAYMATAPHRIPAFTFRAMASVGDLIRASQALAPQIATPALVLAAGDDVFVRSSQVRAWFDRLASPDKTFHLYPQAKHLLWNDLDAPKVLADLAAWLQAHL